MEASLADMQEIREAHMRRAERLRDKMMQMLATDEWKRSMDEVARIARLADDEIDEANALADELGIDY